MTTNEELIAEAREIIDPPNTPEQYLIDRLADALEAATRERDAALAAVEVARKLHHKITRYGNDYYSISAESYEDDPSSYDDLEPFDLCAECYEVERLICEECGGGAPIGHRSSWPCPTVAALDGAPEPEEKP